MQWSTLQLDKKECRDFLCTRKERSTGCTVSEESKMFNSAFTMLLFYERKQGNQKYSYFYCKKKNWIINQKLM